MSDWPYVPRAKAIATSIHWLDADPESFEATMARWRKVSRRDLEALLTQPLYAHVRRGLPEGLESRLNALIQDDSAPKPKVSAAEEPASVKDRLIAQVEGIIGEAEDAGDLRSKLSGVELVAKLERLLSTKQDVDPVITINVITGVPRGSN